MFHEFARSTGIRGFSFAIVAKTFPEKLMWYSIIIICCLATCWDVYDTVTIFLQFPTGTKVTIVSNQSIQLGEPTICVPMITTPETLGDLQMANSSTVVDFLEDFYDIFAENSTLNETVEQKDFIQYVTLMVSVLTISSKFQYLVSEDFSLYRYNYGFSRHHIENEETVKAAAVWFRNHSITIERLKQTAGVLLCYLYKLRVYTYMIADDYTCDHKRITWIGMQYAIQRTDHFCFTAPSDYFKFHSTAESTSISYERPAFFGKPQEVNFDYDYVAVDFTGQLVALPRVPSILYSTSETQATIQIQINGEYKQIRRANNLCSNDEHEGSCLLDCRNQFILKFCNCSPMYQLPTRKGMIFRECSVDHLAQLFDSNSTDCRNITFKDEDLYPDCAKSCNARCQYFTVSFFHIPMTHSDSNLTYLILYVDPYKFAVFEEIPLISAKQFMGSLGGNLSLYLGASFMVLFHVFFYWTFTISNHIRKKQRPSTTQLVASWNFEVPTQAQIGNLET